MPWHDDPDELAGELNSLAPAAAAAPLPDTGRLEHWLRTLVARKGADLLLVDEIRGVPGRAGEAALATPPC